MVFIVKGVAGFTNKDNFADIGGFEDFVELGEVGVVGFVTSANDEDELVVWEGVNGYTGRAGIGGEVIVVVFDVTIFSEKFEAVREAVKAMETFEDGGAMFS